MPSGANILNCSVSNEIKNLSNYSHCFPSSSENSFNSFVSDASKHVCNDSNLQPTCTEKKMSILHILVCKICLSSIKKGLHITFIIYKCISESVFPDTFKTASVLPLHKHGSKSDPNKYRPISNLPSIDTN